MISHAALRAEPLEQGSERFVADGESLGDLLGGRANKIAVGAESVDRPIRSQRRDFAVGYAKLFGEQEVMPVLVIESVLDCDSQIHVFAQLRVPAWKSWSIREVIDRKQCGTLANIRKLLSAGNCCNRWRMSGVRVASSGNGTATLLLRDSSGRAM